MSGRRIRLGVVGLGRAFMLMLPTLARDRRLELVAAADPRPEALRQFATEFAGRTYRSATALAADPRVEAVYIASPHEFHVEHVTAAAAHRKHILVEKPMGLTMEACEAMVAAAREAGVQMIVGHSHGFDAPYLRTREMIESGEFGRVRMITAMNFTDYLYRPRRPEELDTDRGGGVVFGQAPHQVDVVRLIGGGLVRSVLAGTGAWDGARRTEGAYGAHLTFEDGLFASLTYSGYGHFDTDELGGWMGEMGMPRNEGEYGGARRALARLANPHDEAALKDQRTYGRAAAAAALDAAPAHNHFGLVVASCEKADLRPTPRGVMVYGDERKWLEAVPLAQVPRAEVVDELFGAVVEGRPPLHSGEWGAATMEVCLALLRSAREGRSITLERQVGTGRLPGRTALPGREPRA